MPCMILCTVISQGPDAPAEEHAAHGPLEGPTP